MAATVQRLAAKVGLLMRAIQLCGYGQRGLCLSGGGDAMSKQQIALDMIFRRVRELDKRYMNWDRWERKWLAARTTNAKREAEVFRVYWKSRYYELRNSKGFPS